MATKSDFFNENNGRYYLCKNESRITCELKQSWSLAKMQETVAAWQARVDHQIAYEKWEKQLIEYAIALGYSSDEIRWTHFINPKSFNKYQGDIDGAFEELKVGLFRIPSHLQYEQVRRLKPDDTDRHIRLYGDGRVAVGGSDNCWYEIQPDGYFNTLNSAPISETKGFIHTALIKISDAIAVEVEVYDSTFRAWIYFHRQHSDPRWYKAEVWKNTFSGNPCPDVRIPGYGGFDPDLADRAAEALKLGAAIARDFQNFLDRPHEWIRDQYKQPKPTDAVLGGIKA
jgi:hypothetical protein